MKLLANKVRFGLIGCGGIGEVHARAIELLEEAELVAVCDIDIQRASKVAEEHAVAHAGTMLDEAGLDAVTVATDHEHRFAPAMEAMKRGVHAIVEKPITVSLEEAHT